MRCSPGSHSNRPLGNPDAGSPDPGQRPRSGVPLCLHRDRILAGLGRAQRHQPDPRFLHRARRLPRLRPVLFAAHLALVRGGRRRAGILRLWLRPAAAVVEPRHIGAGPGDADADLRARSDPEQRNDLFLQGGLPKTHAEPGARISFDLPCRGAGRSPDRDRDRAGADGPALSVAAALARRPGHRRGAARSRCGRADGRRREIDLRHRLRPRRGARRLRRRGDGADLPDLAADLIGLSRQGVCRLRAGRSRQRIGRACRRTAAGAGRECRIDVPGPGPCDDAVVRASDRVPDPAPAGPRRPQGLRMSRTNGALLVLIAGVAALPLFGGAYALRLGTIACMYSILALSWNVVGGFAGYPSFATAAFFGFGAYAAGVLLGIGVPLWLSVIIAAVAALALAAALGAVLLRLRGHYFAIASLSLVEVLRELVNNATDLTGGGMGLNIPLAPGAGILAEATFFFYAMWGLLLATALMVMTVAATKLGFGLNCIRQNETASSMVGLNTTLYKSIAFGLSACFVSAAGGIYAAWVHYIDPSDVFDILYSVKPIVMALMGGLGSPP